MSIICRFLPIMLALLLLTAGCSITRKSTKPADNGSQATATSPTTTENPSGTPTPELPPIYKPKKEFTSNFTCTTQGVTVNGQLRMKEDSVIWACASKVIELGRARLTQDSVLVYAKVVGRSFSGTYADIYRRYHYRTNFDELYAMLTAPDAEAQILALLAKFKVDATLKLSPWKEAENLTFPITIPKNAKPL